MPTFIEVPLEIQQAARDAEGWMLDYLRKNGITRQLTSAEQLQLSRAVPCTIRCWRIGVAVDLKQGETCPECGKLYDPETFWKKLVREDEF